MNWRELTQGFNLKRQECSNLTVHAMNSPVFGRSALKWVRPRVGGDAGTWRASPRVLWRGVAASSREEKTRVKLESANGGGAEGRAKRRRCCVWRRNKKLARGVDWAEGRRPAPACVTGSKGGDEAGEAEQGERGGEEEEERSKGGGSGFTVPRLLFARFSLFFWIQFYHKTSSYCINNRIPKPLIINRIPKYNRWSAYWPFDYIKDRFSKLQNCYQDSTIWSYLGIAFVEVSRNQRLVLLHNFRKFIFGIWSWIDQ